MRRHLHRPTRAPPWNVRRPRVCRSASAPLRHSWFSIRTTSRSTRCSASAPSRAPEGAIAETIGHLNALPCPVLAVDVPSGLDADTGTPLGGVVRRRTAHADVADAEAGLVHRRPAAITQGGSGSTRSASNPLRWPARTPRTPGCAAWIRDSRSSPRRHAQHKGSFGDVAVVGGAAGMVGAALLAARAAHAAGAGRVYVELLAAAARPAFDLLRPELMFRSDWSSQRRRARACHRRLRLRRRRQRARKAAAHPQPRGSPRARCRRAQRDRRRSGPGHAAARCDPRIRPVLTPHPLEAARLLGCNDRRGASRSTARRTRTRRPAIAAIVVLKGSGSVIAAPGEPPSINASGNASLASAGTGDVLAGWIGGPVVAGVRQRRRRPCCAPLPNTVQRPRPARIRCAARRRPDRTAARAATLSRCALNAAGLSPARASPCRFRACPARCRLRARSRRRGRTAHRTAAPPARPHRPASR